MCFKYYINDFCVYSNIKLLTAELSLYGCKPSGCELICCTTVFTFKWPCSTHPEEKMNIVIKMNILFLITLRFHKYNICWNFYKQNIEKIKLFFFCFKIRLLYICNLYFWRGARVVDRGSLLRSCAFTGTGGSNPFLSAREIVLLIYFGV